MMGYRQPGKDPAFSQEASEKGLSIDKNNNADGSKVNTNAAGSMAQKINGL